MKHRLMTLLLAFILIANLSVAACAEAGEAEAPAEPALADCGLDLGTASVHWPELRGLPDAEIQDALNAQLRAAADADTLTARMALVMSAEPPLTVSWEGDVHGGVLSAVIYREGPLTDDRFRSVWAAVNADTATGEAIALRDLFTDPDKALPYIETWLEDDIAWGLSDHLMNSELTPLPEVFAITPEGLTLYYKTNALSTLSDRAGAVTLDWAPLAPWLDLREDGILARFGVKDMLTPDASALTEALAGGSLPGIPAALGDDVRALVDRYHLLADPDFYDGGRYVQLEDSRFRDVFLMTDALSGKQFDGSTVLGLRTDRFGLLGLITGATVREEWQALLGEPYASVELDSAAAEAMRLVPGTSDYYHCGEHILQLHADEEDVLRSIFLLP